MISVSLNDYENVCESCECSSCTVHIVLFSNIGIGAVIVYLYWYSKKIIFVLNLIPILKQEIIECNSIDCNSVEHLNRKS